MTPLPPDLRVHPSATIAPTARFYGKVLVEAGVRIHDYAVIGDAAEHRTEETDWDSLLVIGKGTVVREHVVVQRGTKGDGARAFGTRVGSGCYLMHGVHVAHDCIVEDRCTLAPNVVLGGHTWLQPFVNMGIGGMTHQNVTVGAVAMVGMGAVVIDHVRPMTKVVGNPARAIGMNDVGLARIVSMVDDKELAAWQSVFYSEALLCGGRRIMAQKA